MVARAGFYALALGAALVMASGAMPGHDAMAQADDVTVQADGVIEQANEVIGEADAATTDAATTDAATTDADDETALDATAADKAVEPPVPQAKSAALDRTVKSNLDQSAVRATPVAPLPHPTRTSTQGTALPKILGVYR